MVSILWATVPLFIETSQLTITRAVLEQPMTGQETIIRSENDFPFGLQYGQIWRVFKPKNAEKMPSRDFSDFYISRKNFNFCLYKNVFRFNLFSIITHLK